MIPSVELVNREPVAPQETGLAAVIERLAMNPDVDVVKLEKIIELQERILRHTAQAEFEAAFADMQGDLPVITERGKIIVNGQTRSTYAKFEDIIAEVRPILQRHGFALRHENEQKDGTLKITGILSHRCGHSVRDEFLANADDSGQKNDIQQLGSTRSYGQRYTTISLLNIVTRGADDDGQRSQKPAVQAPEGYPAWLEGLEDVAVEGTARLETEWKKAPAAFRQFLSTRDANRWAAIKAKAAPRA